MRTARSVVIGMGLLLPVGLAAALSTAAPAAPQSERKQPVTNRSTTATPIVQLRGDPAALGWAHGQQLGGVIRPLFREYFGKFFKSDADRQHAVQAASGFEPFLPPEYREEIQALAKAANMSPQDALLAQSFLDLLPAIGCSTIALPAAAAPDGIARFGRNLDFFSHNVADRRSALLVFHPKDRYAFASVTWPGMIGVLSGMNERGLTLANMEVQRQPRAPEAIPYTLLYRMLLERCKNVDEAIAMLEKTPRQSANNLMLMDASGARAVAEITPEKVTVRRASDSAALISTNHQRGAANLDTPGHCRRYDSLHQAAGRQFGRMTEKVLEQMLAGAAAPADAPAPTIQSMVFEPANRVLYLAVGSNAPRRGFTKYELQPLMR